MESQKGKVWLAGGGPGDAGLLTIKTKKLIESADVIVYDALISTEIMSLIPNDKECIYVGKRAGNHVVPQEEINQILLEQALLGKKVLRLKGGDPFVFGRGGEELELLVETGSRLKSFRESHQRFPYLLMQAFQLHTGISRPPSTSLPDMPEKTECPALTMMHSCS